jgi:hypothetical protein
MPPDFRAPNTLLVVKSADFASPLSRPRVPLMPGAHRYGVTSKRQASDITGIGVESSAARAIPEDARPVVNKMINAENFFMVNKSAALK